MVPALSLDLLKDSVKKKYELDEKRVVGIMLARYEIPKTKKLIKENYRHWHNNTGKYFDVFWAGYGAYLSPDEESDEKIILDLDGNNKHIYYDSYAFNTIQDELFKAMGQRYRDHIELVLVNYYDGFLHFEESFRIDLEKNLDADLCSIRTIMKQVTDICGQASDVRTLLMKLNSERLLEKIKGVSLGNIINLGVEIMGLLKK